LLENSNTDPSLLLRMTAGRVRPEGVNKASADRQTPGVTHGKTRDQWRVTRKVGKRDRPRIHHRETLTPLRLSTVTGEKMNQSTDYENRNSQIGQSLNRPII